MHRCILPFTLLLLSAGASGQVPLCPQDTTRKLVFSYADAPQSFPGGEKALLQFLRTTVHYPDSSTIYKVGGTVYTRFVVTEDGSLTNVCTMKRVDPLLEAEAARVVRAMPKWIPAIRDGKPVRTLVTLPIVFEL